MKIFSFLEGETEDMREFAQDHPDDQNWMEETPRCQYQEMGVGRQPQEKEPEGHSLIVQSSGWQVPVPQVALGKAGESL